MKNIQFIFLLIYYHLQTRQSRGRGLACPSSRWTEATAECTPALWRATRRALILLLQNFNFTTDEFYLLHLNLDFKLLAESWLGDKWKGFNLGLMSLVL